MSVAEKLDRLARIVPGVAGYQDKDRALDSLEATFASRSAILIAE